MHEMAMIKDLVAVLEREIGGIEADRVKTVHLEIGAMRYVVPEILEECFRHMPKHKKLEGACLKVDILPIDVKCSACGHRGPYPEGDILCAKCGGESVEVVSGNEFILKGIEW